MKVLETILVLAFVLGFTMSCIFNPNTRINSNVYVAGAVDGPVIINSNDGDDGEFTPGEPWGIARRTINSGSIDAIS